VTDLKGKTALVTGSTSGIGRATAIALAARGAHVLIVGRDEQRAKDAVAEIEGSWGSAAFQLTTLSDLQSALDLVEWATEASDGHVDILINNAGVALLGPSMAATEAEFDETFAPTRTRMMEAVPDEMVNQLAGLAPAGRAAQPEELAAAIVFLASDEASFVHGVTLAVDGGRAAT
jgi:NAD(P)-dependent dehydrogenase (short-subunit alcohol dehydrogenase family)